MCSVMAGLALAGGALQYKQQQDAADAQASMYRAQAQTAEQNAKVESRKQESIADSYANKSLQLRSRQRLIAGQQRAEAGAAGLGFSGSAMDMLSSSLNAYNTDQTNLLTDQRNDNYASRVTQTNYETQARNNRTAAGNVESQAKMAGIGTILGTAASIYGLSGTGGSVKSALAGTSSTGGLHTISTPSGYGTSFNFSPSAGMGYMAGNGNNILTGKKFFNKNKYDFSGYGY